MRPQPYVLEQMGRTVVYRLDSLPDSRMRVQAEPGCPGSVRVFMSETTWEALQAPKAIRSFYATIRGYPEGLHALFG